MDRRLIALALVLALCLALPASTAAEAAGGTLRFETVIAPQYEAAEPFSEGLAAVKRDGKWGYIDTAGELVIPFRFERAYDFSEGCAVVSPSVAERNVYTLANGSTIEYNYYDLGRVDAEGNYRPFVYTDPKSGEQSAVVVPDIFLPSELVYHNGFVRVTIPELGGQLFDASGASLALAGELDHVAGPMNEGLAPAEGRMEGLVGWVDESGAVAHRFYMRSSGGNVDTFIAATLPFNRGIAPVWQCTTDWTTGESTYLLGFMDRNFEWTVQPQYTAYWRSDIYTDYQIFGETGLAMVAKNGRYGAINMQGETVIPFRYEILGASSEGMILFREGGKYGYLDAETNQVAIEAQYMNATMFKNGLAAVWDGREAGLIDRNGRRFSGISLDRSVYFQTNEDSSEVVHAPDEYVVVRENGLCGFARLSYDPPAPQSPDVDAWALEEVQAAAAEGLVPASMQNLYRNGITRADFCALTVQALSRAAGSDAAALVLEASGRSLADWRGGRPFNDTNAEAVVAAAALGIVSGRGGGRFDPDSGVTRQEAALMLFNTAKAAGLDVSGGDAAFPDAEQIASWAKEAVAFAASRGIMRGASDGAFSPLSPYTREQSFLTVLRLYRCLTE